MAMEPMDAIALLKADHRKVEGLFEKFESAKGAAKKQALTQEICTKLLVHTAIEEEIFYPACAGEVEDDMMNEAYVETTLQRSPSPNYAAPIRTIAL